MKEKSYHVVSAVPNEEAHEQRGDSPRIRNSMVVALNVKDHTLTCGPAKLRAKLSRSRCQWQI